MLGGDVIVMNMTMRPGSGTVMASDNSERMYDKPRRFRISIAVASLQEFGRIFEGLANDAEALEMTPGETFWAEWFAMFTNRYGRPWMLNYEGASRTG